MPKGAGGKGAVPHVDPASKVGPGAEDCGPGAVKGPAAGPHSGNPNPSGVGPGQDFHGLVLAQVELGFRRKQPPVIQAVPGGVALGPEGSDGGAFGGVQPADHEG